MSFAASLSSKAIDECLWFHHRKIAEINFLKNDIKHLECTVAGLICDSSNKKFHGKIITVFDALMYLAALDTNIQIHEIQIANLNAIKVELDIGSSDGYESGGSGGVPISKPANYNMNVSNYIQTFSAKPHSIQNRLELNSQNITEEKKWNSSSGSFTDAGTNLGVCIGRPIPTIQTTIGQQYRRIFKYKQRKANIKNSDYNRMSGLQLLKS